MGASGHDPVPDGQLYVDLRGHGPGEPLSAGAALAHLLVGLGVPADAVPSLDRGHALRVLAQSAGERAVADELTAAGVLADLCDGLPLALRIAAGALDQGARTPTADLVAEMCADGLLAALGVHGDPRARLDISFGYSYDVLGDVERRLFRLLGTLPARDLAAPVVAAAAEMTIGAVRVALRRLADGHLVVRLGGDRYEVRGLLREYARVLAVEEQQHLPARRVRQAGTDAA
ncbi:hypothetical protein [Saccharothrix deserti]|uniref:hypothetical protein n=1 Tax=Saccharothrix deserti TaxID=2593674 RepID=UPI00131B1988|nr:hypothetical protein [Saccharothrix deserti]